MNCDIHLHIEVKLNNKWEHYAAPSVPRFYKLFAKMANVRNNGDVQPISEPKGLPSDLTTLTSYDVKRWDSDGHSHSYLDAAEICELSEWLGEIEKHSAITGQRDDVDLEHHILHTYCFSNRFGGIHKYPEDRPDGVTDVRFVFWFDN